MFFFSGRVSEWNCKRKGPWHDTEEISCMKLLLRSSKVYQITYFCNTQEVLMVVSFQRRILSPPSKLKMASLFAKLNLWETILASSTFWQLCSNLFMWQCVTSSIREWHFLWNSSFKFYETNFMQLVSSVYNSPKEQSHSWETNIRSDTRMSASCCRLLF
jgi:hypothetical protein